MAVTRREFLAALTATTATATLAACGGRTPQPEQAATTEAAPNVDLNEFKDLQVNMKSWHYDAEHKVWWQVGLAYCTKAATATYEKLGIYVPGAYLKPTDEKADLTAADASKTFECALDPSASVGAFTCASAPVVMPINAPGFAAQAAPTSYLYDGLEPYLSAGLVYVYAGCRGRSNGYDSLSSGDGFFSGGAPWAVTDLKAAVRFLRYNKASLPGDMDRIVTFGHAAGGLLAALMGATGNAPEYGDYLTKIGAATHDAEGNDVGDAIAAACCWCPEPPAGSADAAYEWELGQFASADTRAEGTWTKIASSDLAASYASYLNDLALRDGDSQLALDETDGGICTDGSYYEYFMNLVEGSAASFLTSTEFPHAIDLVERESGEFPGSGTTPSETPVTPVVPELVTTEPATDAEAAASEAAAAADAAATAATTAAATTDSIATNGDAAAATPGATPTVVMPEPEPAAVTYASRGDYVSALNAGGRWLTYNESKGTVRVADLGSFVRACRLPTLPVCGFDSTSRSAATNQLFGNDDADSLHFSQQVADVLSSHASTYEQASGWDGALPGDWAGDLAKTDSLDKTMEQRRAMYDPLHYLSGASDGYQSATVAEHWRINVGLAQTMAPISASANLALALKAYGGVKDVAYTPVWGAGRKLAEPGDADATAAFVSWVGSLYPAEAATTEAAQ